jgi:hypothetical protein
MQRFVAARAVALIVTVALFSWSCASDKTSSSDLVAGLDASAPASPQAKPIDRPDFSLMSPLGGVPADTSRVVELRNPRVELSQATSSLPFASLPGNLPVAAREDHEPQSPYHQRIHASPRTHHPDPVAQSRLPIVSMPATLTNFSGQGHAEGGPCSGASCSAPPDPNGVVGPSNYVQVTNTNGTAGLAIWNKSGTLLAGPKNLNSLWSTFAATDPCRTRDDGDPVVVYDPIADRWFITQFSLPNETKNTVPRDAAVRRLRSAPGQHGRPRPAAER